MPKLNSNTESILTEKEKQPYITQPPANSVCLPLTTNGYVEFGHWLENDEIEWLCKYFLESLQGVSYTTPISLTDDNGSALQDALKQNKDTQGKLFIPLNIGGDHWVLLIRERNGNTVNLTLWNPMEQKYDGAVTTRLAEIVYEVYLKNKDVKVSIGYQFGEQEDGFSCGVRILQRILQEAEVKNSNAQAFIKAPTKVGNSNKLFFEFVKMLVKIDPELNEIKSDDLFLTEGTVYRTDSSGKELQLNADKKLAVYLQHEYLNNSSDSIAFQNAHKRLLSANNDDITALEKDVCKNLSKYLKDNGLFRQPNEANKDKVQVSGSLEQSDNKGNVPPTNP
jgi:hypothetical protein